MLSLEAGCGPRVGFQCWRALQKGAGQHPDSLAEGTIHLPRLPVAPSSPPPRPPRRKTDGSCHFRGAQAGAGGVPSKTHSTQFFLQSAISPLSPSQAHSGF